MRVEAVGLAISIALGLGLWAALLRRQGELSLGDMGYVILGIVPGAVVGGRLLHGLAFVDAYLADPPALFDLSRGSLSLLGAVLGGALSGAYVCALLGRSRRGWADAAALPLLAAIGTGKLSLLLAGGGQGLPFDGPWAVAFGGAGPWLSADVAVPAHPAQVYEGSWALIGLLIGGSLLARAARVRTVRVVWGGAWFAAAMAWWLAGRVLAGIYWRDEPLIGPWGVEALLSVVVLAVMLAVALVVVVRIRRSTTASVV